MTSNSQKLWNALNLLEDLIRYGEQTEHPDPPAVMNAGSDTRNRGNPGGQGEGPTAEQRLAALDAIASRIRQCTRCPLSQGRMNAVPGAGVLDPLVMVIGEGPGADEDRRGIPFVGRAGQYLDKWLDAISISRDQTAFIGNIVKCRPPGNRDPHPAESDACLPYLREQIQIIQPRTILSVGRIASQILIGTTAGIGRLRGKTYYHDGVPLVPTYHPSGVLRNPDFRRPVWEDLKRLTGILETMGHSAE